MEALVVAVNSVERVDRAAQKSILEKPRVEACETVKCEVGVTVLIEVT